MIPSRQAPPVPRPALSGRATCLLSGLLLVAVLLATLAGAAWANEDPTPPPKVQGEQWSLVVIPDPQAYTQNYGGTDGYLYDGRFDKQTEWVAANLETLNIRFVSEVGDNVQNFARNPGEWDLAVRALNLLHRGHDPNQPALVPYAAACGNHDYDSSSWDSLASTMYEKNLGPGRFRNPDGTIKEAVKAWYKGDDQGWDYVVDGQVLAKGTGRNSCQTFTAGGREYLHLTLETAATDQAIAWARTVLAANPAKPTIVTTHAFLDGGGNLVVVDRMGRKAPRPNPPSALAGAATLSNSTNDAQQIFDKLIRDNDQVFLVLCGHTYFTAHAVLKNASGHDVHVLEACYHLNKVGGRVANQQAPPGGWPSGYQGPYDTQRNGSTWLSVLVFDPAAGAITRYTYSPLLGIWATDRAPAPKPQPTPPAAQPLAGAADSGDNVPRPVSPGRASPPLPVGEGQGEGSPAGAAGAVPAPEEENRTFPEGDKVIEQFDLDFSTRFP